MNEKRKIINCKDFKTSNIYLIRTIKDNIFIGQCISILLTTGEIELGHCRGNDFENSSTIKVKEILDFSEWNIH